MVSKSRCPVITVDPDKGIKHSDDEPKKTLKTFRSTFNAQEQLEHKNAPFFGVNLGKAMKSSPLLRPLCGSEFCGFSLLKI